MASFFPSLDVALGVAKTTSKVQSKAVAVYQCGASNFAVAYDEEPTPERGLLIGQFKNGMAAAPKQS